MLLLSLATAVDLDALKLTAEVDPKEEVAAGFDPNPFEAPKPVAEANPLEEANEEKGDAGLAAKADGRDAVGVVEGGRALVGDVDTDSGAVDGGGANAGAIETAGLFEGTNSTANDVFVLGF